MVKSHAAYKREQKGITLLREERDNNKKIFEANIKFFKETLELEEASLKDYEHEKKNYKLNSKLNKIEFENSGVVTPIMEYHNKKEWVEAFKELKQFEKITIEKNWNIAKTVYQGHQKAIEMRKEQEKERKVQQKRIEERTPEIEIKLKKYGIEPEVKVKQDYIG